MTETTTTLEETCGPLRAEEIEHAAARLIDVHDMRPTAYKRKYGINDDDANYTKLKADALDALRMALALT